MDRIPILKMGDLLLITIQTDLYDNMGLNLKSDIAACLNKHNSRGVMLDISSVSVVDSFMGRIINDISAISRLLDSETVLVGMRPEVAMTLVELGLDMPNVKTALTVEKAMALLRDRVDIIRNLDVPQ